MRRHLPVLLLLCVLAGTAETAAGQSLVLTGPTRAELTEDRSYEFTWSSEGVSSVNIVIFGTLTPLGGRSRGGFRIVAATGVAAEQRTYRYAVPWIDSTRCTVKIKGYDASGREVVSSERGYGFRPAALAERLQDGIYLDLHRRTNQRLYVERGGRITRAYLCSSSQNYLWMPPNRHLSVPHDHAGVFRVLEERASYWSKLFNVSMPYAMRYLGGHFIHATSRNLYRLLGRPASHGCNRMTRADAKQLFMMTPVGTRVEVIGPKG